MGRLKVLVSICLFFGFFAFTGVLRSAQPPKKKRTSLGLYLTAKEAYAMLKSDPGGVKLIDCRTKAEYCFVGHPAMAVNIPSHFLKNDFNPKMKMYGLRPNPNFVRAVLKRVGPSARTILMCCNGKRSAKAVNRLAKAGFGRVYVITDGFEGDKICDPSNLFVGKRVKNGWKNSRLPWVLECKPGHIYLGSTAR